MTSRWILIFACWWTAVGGALATDFQLVVRHTLDGHPIVLGKVVNGVAISRVDWLISELALQDEDGDWLQSIDWFEFFSQEERRVHGTLGEVPDGKYRALRFRVGVTPEVNHLDPNQISPDSPLHPMVNGLHWGWQGGFVFAAIEGSRDGEAFSYHLANDGNSVEITLPVELETPRDATLRIDFDLAPMFEVLEPGSSHSRDGDPMVAKLIAAIGRGFSIAGVSSDSFQKLSMPDSTASIPQNATPYPLEISSRLPRVELPVDNPPTIEGVALGESLFLDQRLSGNNQQSCATCHDPKRGFSDPRTVSSGAEGQLGRRQSMPLMNLAWHDRFFWDGRADSLRQQVLMPIEDPTEMNQRMPELIEELRADAAMPPRFAAAFGDAEISADSIAKALEQFTITRISQNSKFDRAARRELDLSEQEKRGLELFVTEFDPANNRRGADCFHCHGGNLFTSRRFTNNGLEPSGGDSGRFESSGDRNDHGKFKTPSLRNVGLTAPYMHDGRFATLEEVVEHYNSGIHRSDTLDPNIAKHPVEGLGLSEADKAALVAFLKSLTDEGFGQ